MIIKLDGNWDKGLAFDEHTLSSEYLGTDGAGHPQFENMRTQMGELVYALKYRQDQSVLPKIVTLLDKIEWIEKLDYIIPIPPSSVRHLQPVNEIAQKLGLRREVEVLSDFLQKDGNAESLKNIEDPDRRQKALETSLRIVGDVQLLCDKSVLLLDDVYRSGSTLSVATGLLRRDTEVSKIYVLTMTKTRSNR